MIFSSVTGSPILLSCTSVVISASIWAFTVLYMEERESGSSFIPSFIMASTIFMVSSFLGSPASSSAFSAPEPDVIFSKSGLKTTFIPPMDLIPKVSCWPASTSMASESLARRSWFFPIASRISCPSASMTSPVTNCPGILPSISFMPFLRPFSSAEKDISRLFSCIC